MWWLDIRNTAVASGCLRKLIGGVKSSILYKNKNSYFQMQNLTKITEEIVLIVLSEETSIKITSCYWES